MNAIDVSHVTYKYGRRTALDDVELAVPEGALYALLGPNGSGKTTLLHVLMGLRRPHRGRVTVMGLDVAALPTEMRSRVGYVAEGQSLPRNMRLAEIEAYLAPLYDTWDASLARELRERFALDPSRKIGTLSRGEQVKAALLCSLAPRPRLLVMDEPFTGMDALVKDDLVRGLLDSVGRDGLTVLLCSHDIGELELVADWVGILDRGRLRMSEPIDRVRERFKRVDVLLSPDRATRDIDQPVPSEWLSVERSGARLTFVMSNADAGPVDQMVSASVAGVANVEARDATLREIFVALVKRGAAVPREKEVAA